MADINRITALIDKYLETTGLNRVEANEVSKYLDRNGALSYSTKGQPLRKLLREGKISNAEQPGGKGTSWYIYHSGIKKSDISPSELPKKSEDANFGINEQSSESHGLAPVEDPDSEILILGTLPGKMSLRSNQYYANSSNHFWKIISKVFNEYVGTEYQEKLSFLKKHHIALWDVLLSADRDTSLDSDIKNPVANDLEGFIRNHPKLRVVCLNGIEAYRYLTTLVGHYNIPENISLFSLPSTSSSNTHLTIEQKVDCWKKILD